MSWYEQERTREGRLNLALAERSELFNPLLGNAEGFMRAVAAHDPLLLFMRTFAAGAALPDLLLQYLRAAFTATGAGEPHGLDRLLRLALLAAETRQAEDFITDAEGADTAPNITPPNITPDDAGLAERRLSCAELDYRLDENTVIAWGAKASSLYMRVIREDNALRLESAHRLLPWEDGAWFAYTESTRHDALKGEESRTAGLFTLIRDSGIALPAPELPAYREFFLTPPGAEDDAVWGYPEGSALAPCRMAAGFRVEEKQAGAPLIVAELQQINLERERKEGWLCIPQCRIPYTLQGNVFTRGEPECLPEAAWGARPPQ